MNEYRIVEHLWDIAWNLYNEKQFIEKATEEIDELVDKHQDTDDEVIDDEMYRLLMLKQFSLYVYGEIVRMCLEDVKEKIAEEVRGLDE